MITKKTKNCELSKIGSYMIAKKTKNCELSKIESYVTAKKTNINNWARTETNEKKITND